MDSGFERRGVRLFDLTLFGRPLVDYVRFQRWLLILTGVVVAGKLALSLSGAPRPLLRFLSVEALLAMSAVYYAIRLARSGWGARALFVLIANQTLLANLLIALAVALAILTGRHNVFSAVPPSALWGDDGRAWSHVAAHAFAAPVVVAGVLWLAALVVWVAARRKTAETRPGPPS